MTAAMVEVDDGVLLRTWVAGSASPRRFPVVLVHGGPGVCDYLAPVAGVIDDLGRPADALQRLGLRLDCEVVIVPDAGHFPWLEAPEQFSAVFRNALERPAQ